MRGMWALGAKTRRTRRIKHDPPHPQHNLHAPPLTPPQPRQALPHHIPNQRLRLVDIPLRQHMPDQVPPLPMLVLVRHVETRARATREALVAPRLGEEAAAQVELLDAGAVGEGELVGGQADDGAVARVGCRDDAGAVAQDFVDGEPFAGNFGEGRAGDVAEGGEVEAVDYLEEVRVL